MISACSRLISLKSLSFSVEGRSLFKDLSLSLERGEILVIMGHSGVGKTSLLSLIFEELNYVNSELAQLRSYYLEQGGSYIPFVSIEKNIEIALSQAGLPNDSVSIERLCSIIGLSNRKKNYPAQLSGGEKQRLSLVLMMAANPELALCDEPLSSLDEIAKFSILEMFRGVLKKAGTACIYVTHSIEEAIFIGDRVVVIDGKGIKGELSLSCSKDGTNKDRWSDSYRESCRALSNLLQTELLNLAV